MRKYFIRPGFDFIQLFADGGGGGEGSGTGAGAAAAAAGQNGAAPAQPQTKGAKNPLANVQYGTEAAGPAAAGQETAADDKAAQFDAMIRGDYKDVYEARLKDTIAKRLKGTEDTVKRYDALSPVLDLLATKYGVDVNDTAALSKAIEDDETFYEDEALEKGISVEEVKRIRKVERENKALKNQLDQQKSKEQAEQTFAAWTVEAEKIKQIYPTFDLQTELQNPQVKRLILAGIPLTEAFKAVHADEIIGGAMHYTAGQVAQKVANSVAAGKKRPAEGAMGGQGAVVSKRDVSQLTKADRLEIIRRAERGALIGFD